MSKTEHEEYEQQPETLSDLNLLALNEFKQLVEENVELKPDWKQAVIQLLEHGIPQDLGTLEKLVIGESDVETQTT